jgi:hypothetical protein
VRCPCAVVAGRRTLGLAGVQFLMAGQRRTPLAESTKLTANVADQIKAHLSRSPDRTCLPGVIEF